MKTAIHNLAAALTGAVLFINASASAGQYPVAPPGTSVTLRLEDFIESVPQQSPWLFSPNWVIGDNLYQHPGAFQTGGPVAGTFFVGVFGHAIDTSAPNAGIYLWETTSVGLSGDVGPRIQLGSWDGMAFSPVGGPQAAAYSGTGVSYSDHGFNMVLNSSFTPLSDFGILPGVPDFLNAVWIEATDNSHNQVTAVATAIPEPSPSLLVFLGAIVLGLLRHRLRRSEPAVSPSPQPAVEASGWCTATLAAAVLILQPPTTCHAGDWFVTRPGGGFQHPALLHYGSGGWFLGLTDAMQYGEGLQGAAIGPDGNVYVSDNTLGSGDIMRFNRQTGAFMGYFVPLPGWPTGANALTDPYGIAFGPDRNLYVASMRYDPGQGFGPGRIFRYDGSTGAPIGTGVFVTDGAGGLLWPYDLKFGPDGNLYVSDRRAGVLRFDGVSGAFLGVAAAIGSGSLAVPTGIDFGADGLLYVADAGAASVLRFGPNGSFQGVFVSAGSGGLSVPNDIDFGTDGNLYVAADGNDTVLRYSGLDGQFLGEFTSGASQYFNPSGPAFLCEVPEPSALGITILGLLGMKVSRRAMGVKAMGRARVGE